MALATVLLSAASQAQPLQSVPLPSSPSPINQNTNDAHAVLGDAVDTVDAAQPVSFISKVLPIYPREEECEGVTGKVLLQIKIGPAGDPIDIKIERSSHNRHLDGAAIDAAEKWKFNPTLRERQRRALFEYR